MKDYTIYFDERQAEILWPDDIDLEEMFIVNISNQPDGCHLLQDDRSEKGAIDYEILKTVTLQVLDRFFVAYPVLGYPGVKGATKYFDYLPEDDHHDLYQCYPYHWYTVVKAMYEYTNYDASINEMWATASEYTNLCLWRALKATQNSFVHPYQ